MGHAGRVAVPRGAQGVRKTTPDGDASRGPRGSGARTCALGTAGRSIVAIGSGHCPQSGTRECSRLREGPGSGKKKGERSWAWTGRKVGRWGEEGSPAPACPLSQARTLPGSPGAAAALAAQPRIACLPGRVARASGASARNRARPGGPRAAGERGRPAPGSGDPRARQGPGTRGRDPGREARCGAAGRGADLSRRGSRLGAGRAGGRSVESAAGGEIGRLCVCVDTLPL